jgi:hypothetical protein
MPRSLMRPELGNLRTISRLAGTSVKRAESAICVDFGRGNLSWPLALCNCHCTGFCDRLRTPGREGVMSGWPGLPMFEWDRSG